MPNWEKCYSSLSETDHLGARPADTPMDSAVKLDGKKVNCLVMLVNITAWLGIELSYCDSS